MSNRIKSGKTIEWFGEIEEEAIEERDESLGEGGVYVELQREWRWMWGRYCEWRMEMRVPQEKHDECIYKRWKREKVLCVTWNVEVICAFVSLMVVHTLI